MEFKDIKEKEIYWIIEEQNCNYESKLVYIKKIFKDIQAILVVDRNKNEKKLYYNAIKNVLFSIDEAKSKIKEFRIKKPSKRHTPIPTIDLKNNTKGQSIYITNCWKCKKVLEKNKTKKCKHCGWHICPECGACGCDINKYIP